MENGAMLPKFYLASEVSVTICSTFAGLNQGSLFKINTSAEITCQICVCVCVRGIPVHSATFVANDCM